MAQTKQEIETSDSSSSSSPSSSGIPWLSDTVAQAQEFTRSVADSTDTVLHSTRSYLTDIRSSASYYLPQVLILN